MTPSSPRDIARVLVRAADGMHAGALRSIRDRGCMWPHETAMPDVIAARRRVVQDLHRWCCVDVERESNRRVIGLSLNRIGLALLREIEQRDAHTTQCA